MKSKLTTAILILALLQVLLVPVRAALTLRSQDAIPSAPDVESFTFDTPAMALTVPTAIERGNVVATEWANGAEIEFASMQVDWPMEQPPDTVTSIPPFGWVRLLYVAPIDDATSEFAALSLMFERVSGRLVSATVQPWSVEPDAGGLLDGVTVNDEAAVLAAEIESGTAYRAGCPDRRKQTIISLTRDAATGEPIWSIRYAEDRRNADGTMLMQVNANTGALEVKRPSPGACCQPE